MPAEQPRTLLWAPLAWLPEGWRENVLLRAGPDGRWAEVTADVAQAPNDAEALDGAMLPGMVNAHSHAFQRAFAGRAERRDVDSDDFWSWRERMYAVALRIGPDQLRAIAAQLYLELLRGGYTQVCEFHYLQRDRRRRRLRRPAGDVVGARRCGRRGRHRLDDPAGALRARRLRCAHAARRPASIPLDRRERLRCRDRIAAAGRPLVSAGLAIHSLRGASTEGMATLRSLAGGFTGPIHIHVAEQTAEVDDCLRATGMRPIDWLAQGGHLDARWQLVHATHAEPREICAVAASGAGVVLCPSTEANLGDGLCDLPGWLAAGVPLSLGSDSHATRDWREELRLLEYGQRLLRRQRNVAAAPELGIASTAERLTARMLAGSAAAAGEPSWGLVPGARADALVASRDDAALLGMPGACTLDALVFSSPSVAWRDVMVAGRWVLRDAAHSASSAIAQRFVAAMGELDEPPTPLKPT